VVNALTIIGVITGVTFVMVFLYAIGKIWILVGWLILSTGMLLSFTTSLLFMVFYEKYQIPMDVITHYFMAYNFAIVGVTAIFYQKGIPRILNQGYLVCVSVTMAWLLLRFLPEWTSWALLIFLSFYDLCAVLTPCGPLKCLVKLAQEKDDPLPGLLYEADVRENQNVAQHFAQLARDQPDGTSGSGAYAQGADVPPPPPIKPSNRTASSGSSMSINHQSSAGLEMIENGNASRR
jgi:presenilin 1